MPLGPNKWAVAKPYYDGLSFAKDGDPLEQRMAVEHSDFIPHFRNYESFWRYHVCPATARPNIGYRSGIADIISVIMQRNYSVLRNLTFALDHWKQIRSGDWGQDDFRFDGFIKNTGDALQVATELQFAIEGPSDRLPGMASLKSKLGASFDLFPDWNLNFREHRESISCYRNYLTHQGHAAIIRDTATGKVLLLGAEAFKRPAPLRQQAFTWTQAHNSYKARPEDWKERTAICHELLLDTFAFLDLCYERMRMHLDSWLTSSDYQRLWGWRDTEDPVTTTRAAVPTGTNTAAMQLPFRTTWIFRSASGGFDL